MFVYQGQVATFSGVIPFEQNNLPAGDWAGVHEGMFAARSANGVVPYRVFYTKKKKEGKEGEVTITFDGRPTLDRAGDHPDPNLSIAANHDALAYQYEGTPAAYVDCILSIDLGNTRTVALIVDNVNGTAIGGTNLCIFPLPMCWQYKDGGRPTTGAFESVLSISMSRDDDEKNAFAGDGGKKSFVKLGPFAVFNNREKKLANHAADGRYTMSSPKRYFWDDDLSVVRWIGAVRSVKEGVSTEVGDYWLTGELADAMAATRQINDASRLPVSDMLGAMLVEIYEQAVHYIGSPTFLGQVGSTLPRRIVRIHVTYPSTLLPRELDVYRNRLLGGLQSYLGLFVRPMPVVLDSEIDEASSVLAVYAYSEIHKMNSADMWLRTIGKRSALGHQARIAVIDVGGGTTDLTIAQVEATATDAAVNPFRASLDSLHRDGVNNAGDALIFRFLDNCIKALGLKAVALVSGATEDEIKESYLKPEHASDARRLTQSFWFPLALEIATQCDAIVAKYPEGKYPDGALKVEVKFNDTNGIWKDVWKRIIGSAKKDFSELKFELNENIVNAYLKSADEVFRHDAVVFAKAISAYETDVLVFSGKTAEFAAVRNVFCKRVALPADSIIQMKDFQIGRWCQLADANGRIKDSKVATALGGALYTLRNFMPINLDFHDGSIGIGCDWGIVTGESVAFTTSLFGEGELRQSVPFASGRILLARRMKKSQSAILSYELRIKPDGRARHGGVDADAQIVLVQNETDTSLSIETINGHFQDGVELGRDDVECRLCTMNGAFQMDTIMEL